MAKPLMSRQLLPPAFPAQQTDHILQQPHQKTPKKRQIEDVVISTPKGSVEVSRLIRELGDRVNSTKPVARLLFRKIGKGLDGKNHQIAQYQYQIQALEQEVENLRPQKRRKIREDPNERFVRIHQVIQAKETLSKELGATGHLAGHSAEYHFEDMCTEWQLKGPVTISE